MKTQELLKLVREHFGPGCEHVCEERHEQIHKHGFDVKNDQFYSENELIKASLFSINPDQFEWPFYWDEEYRTKILNKDYLNRLRVAGAFITSEIDKEINNPSQ